MPPEEPHSQGSERDAAETPLPAARQNAEHQTQTGCPGLFTRRIHAQVQQFDEQELSGPPPDGHIQY